ncbi:radical SAM protein [archaeon]|jgi:molybdenum cofactor biosynthesis enzyme MoaA|nr:radical SAM protein [archaeon]MBT3577255.1 radical SAM protein [archaeon]MBT6820503.1 radical SAM protein [archaeon]MBT6956179.1 radical SAM protein [archaeon]MBT7025753.1 radical SAM protein [archaeon]
MKIQTFTIVVGTAACNASCPYCISRMTPKQGLNFELQDVNWLNFDKACRLAQINNVSTVLLTGKGEPLLYPDQITEFLEHMKKFDFPLVEIQTNALVIGNQFEKYEPYLKEWRKLGLNTIAISMVHYDKKRNKEIYTPHSDYIELGEVIDKLHKLGYSIRLSCIMLKDYIDSAKEVKELVKKVEEWGVEQLTVRGVTTPKESEDIEVFNWTKKRQLTRKQLEEIDAFLKEEGNKLMTLDHGGVVYDLHGQNICLSDCLTIKPEGKDLRQLIFFPDGHLRYDWQFKGAVLL